MEQTLPTATPEEAIPAAIVPWHRDDARARYLGLRSSGFSIREALGLLGKAHSTLSHWREDAAFVALENRLPELRRTLGLEYAALEFLRNYRLVLEKDFRVVKDSLTKHTRELPDGRIVETGQDPQDFKYLLQMRSHYTPQQLKAIEELFGSGDAGAGDGQFANFTDYVLSRTRVTETEEIRVGTRKRQESELATIEE